MVILTAHSRRRFPAEVLVADHGACSFSRFGATLVLPQDVFRIVVALAAAAPALVSYDEIIDAVYADCPDGGPLAPRANLKRWLKRWRDPLVILGIEIATVFGRGLVCTVSSSAPDKAWTDWRAAA
ncbi:hypothetical protein [Salinarimonas soli]|uniref:OmpR/PhoB-type domain-containing protein n=1 Tax=Salinarimonas soli TaxID=1638099 RepID=A0A5B2VDW2_9HYPH|nr:hypothetical protein [Salinarimonas soli]KAA2237713.1 hypothetical protein F0L46_08525 [Salinarimonas soli]